MSFASGRDSTNISEIPSQQRSRGNLSPTTKVKQYLQTNTGDVVIEEGGGKSVNSSDSKQDLIIRAGDIQTFSPKEIKI